MTQRTREPDNTATNWRDTTAALPEISFTTVSLRCPDWGVASCNQRIADAIQRTVNTREQLAESRLPGPHSTATAAGLPV